MKTWVFNPGSSSIKWAWFAGLSRSVPEVRGEAGEAGLEERLATLTSQYPAELCIVRFVHGGSEFVEPLEITRDSLARLSSLDDLAPLHNRRSLSCVRAVRRVLPRARVIVVFDTQFFHDLPGEARDYGLPARLTRLYGIRRFGFHGFAHAGMALAWRELAGTGKTARASDRVVTMQLGSGCSMAALSGGRPVETTMGFTPNEGLLMRTRSGDIDPGLVTWLQRHEQWTVEETDRVLNEESGWWGMSGESANMADLLASESEGARRAVKLFTHRVRKTLGAYHALLGGLDAVILSGGIAEHAPGFCRDMLDALGHLGLEMAPPGTGESDGGLPRCLTAGGSPAQCWVVAGREYQSMRRSVIDSGLAGDGDEDPGDGS